MWRQPSPVPTRVLIFSVPSTLPRVRNSHPWGLDAGARRRRGSEGFRVLNKARSVDTYACHVDAVSVARGSLWDKEWLRTDCERDRVGRKRASHQALLARSGRSAWSLTGYCGSCTALSLQGEKGRERGRAPFVRDLFSAASVLESKEAGGNSQRFTKAGTSTNHRLEPVLR